MNKSGKKNCEFCTAVKKLCLPTRRQIGNQHVLRFDLWSLTNRTKNGEV